MRMAGTTFTGFAFAVRSSVRSWILGTCTLGPWRGRVQRVIAETYCESVHGRGVGVDIEAQNVAEAEAARKKRRAANLTFQEGHALEIPCPKSSFDVVLFLGDVLAYPSVYGNHARALAEIRRVLKKDGMASTNV